MTRPTFFEGVAVALAAATVAAVVFPAIHFLVPGARALGALVVLLGFGYVAYLLARAPVRIGRVTAALGWCVATGVAAFLDLSVTGHVLVQVTAVWLVRSLYYHASVLAALADLALAALGVAAAMWAVGQSASVFLSVWCLLLVQALFVGIPAALPRRAAPEKAAADDRFERAHRDAESALRRLARAE